MRTPFKKYVTSEQYANAERHWEILISGKLPGGFDMALFNDLNGQKLTDKNKCGTVACSAGYVPFTLTIPANTLPLLGNGSIDYDNIINDFLGINFWKHVKEWKWCFSEAWQHIDNSAKGAGIRMRILYEEGLPSTWAEQLEGEEPLQYKSEL